jgi:hypothetical protein
MQKIVDNIVEIADTVTMTTTTKERAMTRQIAQLRQEAGQAGDLEQVAICDRALQGDGEAIQACEDVIEAASAPTTLKELHELLIDGSIDRKSVV